MEIPKVEEPKKKEWKFSFKKQKEIEAPPTPKPFVPKVQPPGGFSFPAHSIIGTLETPLQFFELAIERFRLADFYNPKQSNILYQWGLAASEVAREVSNVNK